MSVHGGTLLRTGAALMVPLCLALAVGTERLASWLASLRGYAPSFVHALIAFAWISGSGSALYNFAAREGGPLTCEGWRAVPPGALAWFEAPLLSDWHCARPGAVWTASLSPEKRRTVTERYDVCHAVMSTAPAPQVDDQDRLRLIPGWLPIADGVWRHPEWDGTSCTSRGDP